MYGKTQSVHLPVVFEFIIWLNEPGTKAQHAMMFHEGSIFPSQADIAVEFSGRNDHGRGGTAGTRFWEDDVWLQLWYCGYFIRVSVSLQVSMNIWKYEDMKIQMLIPRCNPPRKDMEYRVLWRDRALRIQKASSQRSRILFHGGVKGITWGSGLRGVDARTLVRVPSRD